MQVIKIPKKEGLIDRKTGKILKRKLRVAAYARVSTLGIEQLNSYESQKKYYYDKINDNPEWEYVNIYADEGISGTTDYRRAGFMRMIQDALDGKIDLILTKSISRFGRNTMDVLKNVRLLRENNVAVLFEENNLNTLDTRTSEILLITLSAVAQQESENISEHVKLGLHMKMNRGELVGFNGCYGYKVQNEKIVIIEEEAEIVKFIFEKYSLGHGANAIAKMLMKQGIKSPKGSEKWSDSTIRGILRNEKYKGDILQGKTYTVDPISHRRYKNMGEEDQYYILKNHEAIIDGKQFDDVQKILKDRCGARASGRSSRNIDRKFTFSGRIRCGFCGNCYTRRTVTGKNYTKIPSWSCTSFAKNGKENCLSSKTIREEIIEEAFVDAYKLLISNSTSGVEKILNIKESSIDKENLHMKIEMLKKQYQDTKFRKNRLIDLVLDKKISEEDFEQKIKRYNEKLDKLGSKIEQLTLILEDKRTVLTGLEKIKQLVNSKQVMEVFDKEIFCTLVDYVIAGGYDENGIEDPYIIRFILKPKFGFNATKEISNKLITEKSKINIEDKNVILDFVNSRRFFSYERDGNGKLSKVLRNGLRIKVECGNIENNWLQN